jgi:hypothetical protein
MVAQPVTPAFGRLRQEDGKFEAKHGLHSENLSENQKMHLIVFMGV